MITESQPVGTRYQNNDGNVFDHNADGMEAPGMEERLYRVCVCVCVCVGGGYALDDDDDDGFSTFSNLKSAFVQLVG